MVNPKERTLSALQQIVDNANKTRAVDWAVNYARYAIQLLKANAPTEDIHTQLLYIIGNITKWRGDTATVVRGTLKEAIKHYKEA